MPEVVEGTQRLRMRDVVRRDGGGRGCGGDTKVKNERRSEERRRWQRLWRGHKSSPKLPLKHSAQRKIIHGVGMETVYVCMWQGSDSIHTHNQPIKMFRLTSYT